jgi:hypothetical protein
LRSPPICRRPLPRGRGASLLWAAAATKAHDARTGVELAAIHRPAAIYSSFFELVKVSGGRLSQQAHDRHSFDVNRNTIQGAIAVIADVIFRQ